ncbi:histidine utilization repressor [Methylovirgula sp. 4M-Z18]|uniref:histidine utilization repressor n=1 Tax=Methylovirgula sp. 4M-Z18 TaxID=2293567 RepID=UPI000E2FDB34|nr:histidine utilization repressor [Methylovirgula sp. 4M-Z18]RFB75650.1 histidine utilization repressor [Methylovirgula sp. 4M-Z18]
MSMLSENKREAAETSTPLYAEVKQHILARVRSGEWPPDHRIPSESELVEQLGVSRMTVNRALRELSLEGVLVRMQGKGSFVSGGNSRSDVFAVGNIADEIRGRGHDYSAQVLLLDTLKATPDVADLLELPIGSPVFHSIIVHYENDVPVQLEDRFVNPLVVPHYLEADFSKLTPNHVLSAVVPWSEAEHRIEAVLPQPWECKLLAISRSDPCLLIRRRTWTAGQIEPLAQPAGSAEDARTQGHVVTSVRLLLPGGRYRIENRRQTNRAD